jgi:hypothetical protein
MNGACPHQSNKALKDELQAALNKLAAYEAGVGSVVNVRRPCSLSLLTLSHQGNFLMS